MSEEIPKEIAELLTMLLRNPQKVEGYLILLLWIREKKMGQAVGGFYKELIESGIRRGCSKGEKIICCQ